MGQDVRLIPVHYVKPFVKWQKNNATEAEASGTASEHVFPDDQEPGATGVRTGVLDP
jgi:hypothetical protein